jgi:Trypsin-like peptidase domain
MYLFIFLNSLFLFCVDANAQLNHHSWSELSEEVGSPMFNFYKSSVSILTYGLTRSQLRNGSFRVDNFYYRFTSLEKDFIWSATSPSKLKQPTKRDYRALEKQARLQSCSGCLVGKNKLITAKHCVEGKHESVSMFRAAFDFNHDSTLNQRLQFKSYLFPGGEEDGKIIPSHEFLKISSIETFPDSDIALLHLEQDVSDREPISLDPRLLKADPALFDGEKLFLAHHPGGLPTKVSSGTSYPIEKSFRKSVERFTAVKGPVIYSDYAATKGSSGACVLNQAGQLVSIHNARAPFFIEQDVNGVFSIVTDDERMAATFYSSLLRGLPDSLLNIESYLIDQKDIYEGSYPLSMSVLVPPELVLKLQQSSK